MPCHLVLEITDHPSTFIRSMSLGLTPTQTEGITPSLGEASEDGGGFLRPPHQDSSLERMKENHPPAHKNIPTHAAGSGPPFFGETVPVGPAVRHDCPAGAGTPAGDSRMHWLYRSPEIIFYRQQ